ncbi:MAG: hypothetical protein KJ623_01360 [Nanoarchaeota archaeon]|nr:hypothetical protein [Nanoarchaeota archaeon]MBU0963227.1 hypothetical protein [Nanoarchaeota archaeon]
MADKEYDDIKKQVGEDMEAPSPSSEVSGMRPSILSKRNSMQDMSEEQSFETPQFEMPQPITPTPAITGRADMETIEQIAESIVNEKWEDLMASVGNIALWKEKIQTDVRSIKQEIMRIEERFENLQSAILGRVEEYHKTISTVGTEMKALEGVLERILQPLVSNIKELSRITEDLKKK